MSQVYFDESIFKKLSKQAILTAKMAGVASRQSSRTGLNQRIKDISLMFGNLTLVVKKYNTYHGKRVYRDTYVWLSPLDNPQNKTDYDK